MNRRQTLGQHRFARLRVDDLQILRLLFEGQFHAVEYRGQRRAQGLLVHNAPVDHVEQHQELLRPAARIFQAPDAAANPAWDSPKKSPRG